MREALEKEMNRKKRKTKKEMPSWGEGKNKHRGVDLLFSSLRSQAAKRFSMGDNSHKVDGEVVVDDRALPSPIFLSLSLPKSHCPSGSWFMSEARPEKKTTNTTNKKEGRGKI